MEKKKEIEKSKCHLFFGWKIVDAGGIFGTVGIFTFTAYVLR